MLFWILYFISILAAAALSNSMAVTWIGGFIFFFLFLLLFSAIDILIMGFLSLIFSAYKTRERITTYPLIRLDETSIVYQDENGEQVPVPRKLIYKTKKTETMDKLEIVEILPNLAVEYWLWDIVEHEPTYNLLLRKGEE